MNNIELMKASAGTGKTYSLMKKLIEICMSELVFYIGSLEEAVYRMIYPEKPRVYSSWTNGQWKSL